MPNESTIHHVSDTALWVAHFRAEETERSDALFRDPFAKALAGERGRKIAESMKATSRYTGWTLVIRTHVIDRFVRELVAGGVDTVLNLGTGLDTRPYRLDLPAELKWIEVDYPHLIDRKERQLQGQTPRCRLERVRLDLSDRAARGALFTRVAAESKQTLVITEGVLPYLTEAQVGELADDLALRPQFRYWIGEYFSPQVYRHIMNPKRMKELRNAPFRFAPADWFGFFRSHGWTPHEVTYLQEESIRLGRKVPMPWWAELFRPFLRGERAKQFRRYTGYVVFEPAVSQNR